MARDAKAAVASRQRGLMALLLAAALTGCGEPRLDTRSAELRSESWQALLDSLADDDARLEMEALILVYFEPYEVAGHIYNHDPADLHGMTAAEIRSAALKHEQYLKELLEEEIAAEMEYQRYLQKQISTHLDVRKVERPTYFAGISLDLKFVTVRNRTDQLEIKSIKVNRGHCKILSVEVANRSGALPRTLQYGQTLEAQLSNACDVLEVELETDQGNASYSFN